MSDIMTGIRVFQKLLDLLDQVKRGQISKNKEVDEALKKTHEALVETQSYLIAGTEQNRDTELNLAKLWYAASIPMRHVNKEFANIIHEKGGYWSNPESWNDLASGDIDITIENVVKLTGDLLQK